MTERAVSFDMVCMFCGRSEGRGVYLEMEVTLSRATGDQVQFFGVHSECLKDSLLDSSVLYLDNIGVDC